MTVAPTAPHTGPRSMVRASDAATGRGTADPANSFAQLLWAKWDGQHLEFDSAPSAPSPPQLGGGALDAEQDGGGYRLVTDIAESAIRFDAKPVVAPSQVDEPDANLCGGAAVAASQIDARQLQEDVPLHSEVSVFLDDLQRGGDGPIGQPDGGSAAGPEQTAKSLIGSVASFAAGVPFRPGPAVGSANQPGEGALERMSSATLAAMTRRLPASIAVMPTEVVVTVHGLPLTAAERDALVVEARQLLVERGLGNRVIRVQSGEGRTSPWR